MSGEYLRKKLALQLTIQKLIHFIASSKITGLLIAFVGILMIVGFFGFNWIEVNPEKTSNRALSKWDDMQTFFAEEARKDRISIEELQEEYNSAFSVESMEQELEDINGTAWDLFASGDEIVLQQVGEINNRTRIDDVKDSDVILIGIPLLAIVLILLAQWYVKDVFDDIIALTNIATLSVFLFVYPFIWEWVKSNDVRDFLKNQLASEGVRPSQYSGEAWEQVVDFRVTIITSSFSTGEQKVLAIFALFLSIGTLAAIYLDRRNFPNGQTETPSAQDMDTEWVTPLSLHEDN